MDDDQFDELSDRIDGLRMIISVLITMLPNHMDVMWKLQQTEKLARERNLPTGVLEELSALRDALEDF